MTEPYKFLHLFTCESYEFEGGNTVFKNCVILKDMDNFKAGDRVEAIEVQISLNLWTSSTDFEETHVII